MKIIVNDANILIDLIELGLLPNFFDLDFEFLTTSLVFEELLEDQKCELNKYIERGVLFVHEMTELQLAEINAIQKTKPSLSPQDCSAFYQAQIEEGILVTSDNTLRKFAKSNEMVVHGHLWVFDRMFEAETITGAVAIDKLNELCYNVNQNLGLPINECNKRIESWKQSK